MTLKEFLNMSECDYDTYDTHHDTIVTCCDIGEIDKDDPYDVFCDKLYGKVKVVKPAYDGLIVNWSEFIEKHLAEFRKFSNEHWYRNTDCDDENFIYQWIKEFNGYLAGMVSESFYPVLNEFLDKLEGVTE